MTVLEALDYDHGRIFQIKLSKDQKMVNLIECCDLYFSVDMDRAKFGQLIAELQAIHDQMVE